MILFRFYFSGLSNRIIRKIFGHWRLEPVYGKASESRPRVTGSTPVSTKSCVLEQDIPTLLSTGFYSGRPWHKANTHKSGRHSIDR